MLTDNSKNSRMHRELIANGVKIGNVTVLAIYRQIANSIGDAELASRWDKMTGKERAAMIARNYNPQEV